MFGLFKRKPPREEVINTLFDNANAALKAGKMFTMRFKNESRMCRQVFEIQFHRGSEARKGWNMVMTNPDVVTVHVSRSDICLQVEQAGFLISDVIFSPRFNDYIPESLMAVHLSQYGNRYVFNHGDTVIYLNQE